MIFRGLTLWRPWAASIVHGPKRVENRPWPAPASLVAQGLWLAIHAGKKWDEDGAAFIAGRWTEARAAVAAPDGSCDGSARCEDVWPYEWTREGIVGVARVVRAIRFPDDEMLALCGPAGPAPDPWAFGPWCWELADVRALTIPYPMRGMQGLWGLPPSVEKEMRDLATDPTR